MTRSCSHDVVITGHRIVQVARGNGAALPKFDIYEDGTCSRCHAQGYRLLTSLRAVDAREAGLIARIPEKDLPAPAAPSKTPAMAMPLTTWPFKSSTWFPKEGSN